MKTTTLPIAYILGASIAICAPIAAQAQPLFLSSLAVSDMSSNSNGSSTYIPAATSSSSSNSILYQIGPSFSVYFPTSKKTSDVFGKSWTSIGIGLGSTTQAISRGTFSPYLDLLHNNHNNNSVYVVPVGISYRKTLGLGTTAPYYGLQGFIVGVDEDVPSENIHYGLKYGVGAREALGYEFSKYAYVEAAYQETTTVKSFDFSGTEIEIGLRF